MGDPTPEVIPAPVVPAETQPDKSGKDTSGENKPIFTQADLDHHISERLKRVDTQAEVKKLLESLGVSDPEALKKMVADKQAADEASKSELEKAQAKAADWEKKYKDLSAEFQLEKTQRLLDKRDVAIMDAATKARANEPKDVLVWLEANAPDKLKAALTAEGEIDTKAVNEAISHVQKERKTWFGRTGPGSPSNSGGKVPEPDEAATKAAREAMFKRMRKY